MRDALRHLDPNRDIPLHRIGVALLCDDDPKVIRDFYYSAGRMPAIHPAVLYVVSSRGTLGDKLAHAQISLDNGRVLDLYPGICSILSDATRLADATEDDIYLARRTLERVGPITYEAQAKAGDGTTSSVPVDITDQIDSYLAIHLSTPVTKSPCDKDHSREIKF